jgi:hypothetical protein
MKTDRFFPPSLIASSAILLIPPLFVYHRRFQYDKIIKNPFIIESSIKYKEKIEADSPSIATGRLPAGTHVDEKGLVNTL